MYSPLGLVKFVAVEGTFVCFTKGHNNFISNSIRCGCLRNDQCNIACLHTEMHSQLAAALLRGGDELCRVISDSAGAAAISIMFLDTLCSKKWYDMPHIGCGIHSLQWSTISRIGRHSAVYN